MAWLMLFTAGLFEVMWAIGLKYAQGFTRLVPSVFTVAGLIASILLLAQATRSIPIGTAYAIWTGIGAIGTAVLAMILFNEPRNLVRLTSILLIVIGIAGLRWGAR